MEYKYDSSGVYSNYFVLCLLGLFIFPVTWIYIQYLQRPTELHQSDCQSPEAKEKLEYLKNRDKRTLGNPRPTKLFITWFIGWLLFIFIAYRTLNTEVEVQALKFDPYEILGIQVGATPEEIRKLYKKLSLKYHPDKVPESEKESSQEAFVRISKAYGVLTDDAMRENWELYGDPDGRQSMEYGIALPAWIVDPSNKFLVLAVYGTLMGLLMPYLLAKWWNRSKKFTREGILNLTMGVFFQDLKENFNAKRILELLCASVEFQENIPWRGQRDMDAVMALFREVRDKVYEKTGEKVELPKKYNQAYCYKAFVIAYAHIFRIKITDKLLLEDSYYIVSKLPFLAIHGIMNLTTAHYWLNQSIACLEVSRMVVQAVPSAWNHTESSELHQLPYFDAEKIKLVRNKRKSVKTISGLMDIALQERKDYLAEVGLSPAQIHDVIAVGRQYPRIYIRSAEFVCVGENQITPGCLVTFMVRLKCVNMKDEEKPGFKLPNLEKSNPTSPKSPRSSKNDELKFTQKLEDDFEDDDVDEDSIKASRLTKLLSGTLFENTSEPAYCPFFPEVRKPTYYVYLCNPRNNRVVGAPMPVANLNPGSSRTVKFSFQAPSQTGTFTFACMLQSDTYCLSMAQEVRMTVEKVKEESEKDRETEYKATWKDLEEEEEMEKDGLMGAQSAMMAQQMRLSKEAEADDDTDWESSCTEDESTDDEDDK